MSGKSGLRQGVLFSSACRDPEHHNESWKKTNPYRQGCGNTMPDLADLVPLLKISIYLSLDKSKICIKLIKDLYFTFLLIIKSSHVILKTVDPDQLAAIEAN